MFCIPDSDEFHCSSHIDVPFTLISAEDEHSALQTVCEELKQKLASAEADKRSQYLKMSAEVDDLNRTKTNLEERLIELIRYEHVGLTPLNAEGIHPAGS